MLSRIRLVSVALHSGIAHREIVFDPSVFARQFEQLTELKKQVDTLTSQLKVAQDQLDRPSSSMTLSTSSPTPTTSEPPEHAAVPESSAERVL